MLPLLLSLPSPFLPSSAGSGAPPSPGDTCTARAGVAVPAEPGVLLPELPFPRIPCFVPVLMPSWLCLVTSRVTHLLSVLEFAL